VTTSAGHRPNTLDRQSDLSLLLIEDSAADSELFQDLLEDELPRTTVTTCRTLAAARALVSTEHYDVVMADLGLPDAHGLSVVEAVRKADRSPALLVLTGRDDSSLALTALSFGAQDYLVKGRHDGESLATAVLHAVQRQRAERASHLYLQMAKGLLDAIEAPTCAVDQTGRIVTVNSAWRRFAEEAGHDPDRSAEGSDYLAACELGVSSSGASSVAGDVALGLRDVLAGRQLRFQAEYPCHSPAQRAWFSVRISPTEIEGSTGAVISHVDVTVMHQVQETFLHQSLHDALTGLPNRVLLIDRLERALVDSARQSSDVAVAFLDLDHFKRVNDSLGHPAGDDLLRQVAERLTGAVRQGDTLSRYAGDEFVVLFRDLTDPVDAGLLCDRLLRCFERPFHLGGSDVVVTASIGVVTGRAPQTVDELLLSADASMYDAKARGRGRVRIFSAELRHEAEARLAIETGLRSALAAGQLVLHYQPVVSLVTGRAVGAEALVRWQHPERGLLGPDSFIPVAEATGLILPLGAWVLTRACTDAASWTGALAGLEVAVNLSARQLTQSDVVSQVAGALSTSGLEPSRLLLEVTESAMLEDADAAGRALDALAELGVRIAVDDFGTGYSSLLYLRRYPISVLKIDRAFIAGVASNTDDHAICTSVVTLGHAVDAMTIAEGVETLPQMAALESMGCRRAQGFLWSRGVPLDQLAKAVDRCAAVPVPAASTRLRVPLACTSNDPDTSQ
jgi:diguanylate cyclase (GGDEF)-like protein